jgi:RNA polymerase sigma-70 factor (ECF subfamily)
MDASLGMTDRTLAPAATAAAPAARKVPAARNETKDRELCALMRSAQDGDRAAYVALLQEVLPIVKRVVQSRIGFLSASDREDIVQEILLSLHAARATYDPERPFTPWLMTIIHNRMVDNARRYSRRSANEVLVDELPAHVADDGADRATNAYGDPEALREAVKSLPKGQRTAIELLKLREMSLKEASAASGMSISALKVSVHRAIKTLRASLNG